MEFSKELSISFSGKVVFVLLTLQGEVISQDWAFLKPY